MYFLSNNFGLLIDNDLSDINVNMSTIVSAPEKLPDKVSLREYCSPIVNQGERGFCWAFTAAEFKAIQERIETGRTYQMSPLYCAKIGKSIDGLDEDGATSKTLFKVITETGAIEEQYYPYSLVKEMGKDSLKFPEINDKNISHYKCQLPVRLHTTAEIDAALANGHPVALGIICLNTIYDLNDNKGNVIPMPCQGYIVGAHEIIVAGYDNTMVHKDKYDGKEHKGFYLIKNTWGTKWGDKGWAWMPKDYLTFGAWVTDKFKLTFFVDAYTAMDLTNEPTNENVITMYIGDKKVRINGEEVEWDVAPCIQKDRTLVPLRGISEILGYKIDWYDPEKRIILTKNDIEIVMFIGSNLVMVNGKVQTWDVAPTIDASSARTLVPLRAIAELLGYYVIWKDDNKEITLVKQG